MDADEKEGEFLCRHTRVVNEAMMTMMVPIANEMSLFLFNLRLHSRRRERTTDWGEDNVCVCKRGMARGNCEPNITVQTRRRMMAKNAESIKMKINLCWPGDE